MEQARVLSEFNRDVPGPGIGLRHGFTQLSLPPNRQPFHHGDQRDFSEAHILPCHSSKTSDDSLLLLQQNLTFSLWP